jgi:predicted SnoaL-like aldol condensation-catalyzing enzyme
MSSNKNAALEFERLIVTGQIRDAYERYVSPTFRHHNPYFPGDRASLLQGMEENADAFPGKIYEVQRALEEGDLVVVHARLQLNSGMPPVSVVHLYRFEDGMIAEEWDLAQQAPPESPNENGLF